MLYQSVKNKIFSAYLFYKMLNIHVDEISI